MNSIISEDRLFDHKFIEEVNNMSVLKEDKDYTKMKLSRVIDSFFQKSSVITGNTSLQSYCKDSQVSMFSKQTSTSRLIPEARTLAALERDPECRFAAQLLRQRLGNKMVADAETTRNVVQKIQRRLIERRRLQLMSPSLNKKDVKLKKLDK